MKNKIFYIVCRMVFLLLIPLVSIIHFKLNTYRPGVRSLELGMDSMFQFQPIFSIPYLYWVAFVYIVLAFFAVNNGKVFYKLLLCTVIGMMTSEVIFYFFPTTVVRPNVEGGGILYALTRFVYSIDNPYNCFPSIHVLNAMLGTMFYYKYGKGQFVKVFAVVSCVLISLSTLYIKQHYILDVVVAAILAVILYWIFENKNILGDYFLSKLPFSDDEYNIELKLRRNKIEEYTYTAE